MRWLSTRILSPAGLRQYCPITYLNELHSMNIANSHQLLRWTDIGSWLRHMSTQLAHNTVQLITHCTCAYTQLNARSTLLLRHTCKLLEQLLPSYKSVKLHVKVKYVCSVFHISANCKAHYQKITQYYLIDIPWY